MQRDAANSEGCRKRERDAANAAAIKANDERDDAVARVVLLQTVTQIAVVGDPEYSKVTPGVYEIASGGTNTAPGDDITFTCPADGPLCVVIVTVNETGASYTSLGGAATGANSVSATATIAALALHGPERPGLDSDGTPFHPTQS